MAKPIISRCTSASVSPNYLLFTLTLFYTSSFVDRAIINILAEPIKLDLSLTDTELGILGGIAFAILYSVLGIPVARIAERKSRRPIITAALTIWSLMTVLCSAATNFWQLAAARAGVGIGQLGGFRRPFNRWSADRSHIPRPDLWSFA